MATATGPTPEALHRGAAERDAEGACYVARMKSALLFHLVGGACLWACVSGGSNDKTAPPAPRETASVPSGAPSAAPSPPADTPPVSTGGRMVYDRYYVDSTAPDPLACTADKDCIGDTVTDEKGCCIASSRAWPQSWPYHTWLSTTRRRASPICKAMQCPPIGSPSMPAKCEIEVKCVVGKCQNTCGTKNP